MNDEITYVFLQECGKCEMTLPLTNFTKRPNNKYNPVCKKCTEKTDLEAIKYSTQISKAFQDNHEKDCDKIARLCKEAIPIFIEYRKNHREEGDWCYVCNKTVDEGNCECECMACYQCCECKQKETVVVRYPICSVCSKTTCHHLLRGKGKLSIDELLQNIAKIAIERRCYRSGRRGDIGWWYFKSKDFPFAWEGGSYDGYAFLDHSWSEREKSEYSGLIRIYQGQSNPKWCFWVEKGSDKIEIDHA